MKLHLAMLFAKDIERMTAFYRDGFRLSLLPEKCSEGWVVFDAGGTLFALHAIPAAIASQIHIADIPEERSDSPTKLVFQTDDLDTVCIRLEKLGAKLFAPWASGSRDVADPEGNILQLKRA